MSSKSWTYLTKWRGTYSGGRSPIPYGGLLGPRLPSQIDFVTAVGNPEPELIFQATVDYPDEEVALRRFLSHVILAMVPDNGVDEALFSLRDIVEFYYEPRQPLLPQVTTSYTARVGRATERPDLVISE